MEYHQTLPAGTVLNGEYRVIRLLGSGGFGNTYLALDTTLDREVAIKEYFPSELVYRSGPETARLKTAAFEDNFKWGRDRFVQEGRTLARFRHPNIVRVFRTFDANDTSYMVLEFVNGADMEVWLKSLAHRPSQTELDVLVTPLLNALEMVHEAGILHRDIKPANIYIRKEDGSPVLLDFGAARYSVGELTGTTAAIVSRGYSPHEGYATDAKLQGPWTDLYGLAATLYRAISGEAPPEAAGRVLDDNMVPASSVVADPSAYRPEFLTAIEWGLAVLPKSRPQSVAEWRPHLLPGGAAADSTTGPRPQPGPVSGPPGKAARGPDSRPSGAVSRPSQQKGATKPNPTIAAPKSDGPPVRAIAAGLAAVVAFGGFTALAMWQTGMMPNPFASGQQTTSNDPVSGNQQPTALVKELEDKQRAEADQRAAGIAKEEERKRKEEERKAEDERQRIAAAEASKSAEQRRKEEDRKAAEERQRIAMLAKQAEEERKAEDERQRQAAIQKKAEEKKRREDERKAEEDRQRQAAAAKAEEERKRKEDERKAEDERQRVAAAAKAEEERKRKEEERKAEDDRQRQAALAREADEQRRKEEERRADEERQRQAALARQAEEEQKREDARRAAEERDAAEKREKQARDDRERSGSAGAAVQPGIPSATDRPDAPLYAELVKKIQSGLKDRRCYDGEVNGDTSDADQALTKFNSQLESKGRDTKTIRLASATIEDFESWMKWFNSVDGITCSTPEPKNRPRVDDDKPDRADRKKPKDRTPVVRAPSPPQQQYRPKPSYTAPPSGSSSVKDLLKGSR